MLAWEHKSTQMDKAENKGLGRGTVTRKCFVFHPLTDVPIPSWALRHESITTLSTGHLYMSYLPGAPSIHYSDGHMSDDEEKSSDLQQSFAASHLGSWTGSCKKKDRQLLSSLGEDRPLPTDQLLYSLNWQSVLFFLKEAVVCVCLVWKRSIFVQYSSWACWPFGLASIGL